MSPRGASGHSQSGAPDICERIAYIAPMRNLILASTLTLLPLPALAVDWHVGVTFKHGKVAVGSDGLYARVGYPEHRRHRRVNRRPVYVIYPGNRAPEAAAPVEKAIEAPPPVESKPVAAPPPPPDPTGAASRQRARGALRQRQWTVGDYLPTTIPHVKLAARTYDLPPEPEGQIYARVRGELLLIDAVTRRVEAIIQN